MRKIFIILLLAALLTACGDAGKAENIPLEVLPPEDAEISKTLAPVEHETIEAAKETLTRELTNTVPDEGSEESSTVPEAAPEELVQEDGENDTPIEAPEIDEASRVDTMPETPTSVTATIANSNGATVNLPSGTLVWKSATGEKFHSINDCGNMNPDKAEQITVDEAVNHYNLEACEKCY